MGKPSRDEIALVGFACLLCALLSSCWASDDRPPNVFLITIDTLRADHVSTYGAGKASTPSLDSLAAGGARFETAYCDVTWTMPSMASTLTGTLAARHGVRAGSDRLSDEQTTVAELLQLVGYRTVAVLGSYPLSGRFGLNQGFDVYDDAFTQGALFDSDKNTKPMRRTDAEVAATASLQLRELAAQEQPFFLWAHFLGPHLITDARYSFDENNERHKKEYPRKVERTDAEVGRLLATLDELDVTKDTLVIVHSDHGESLGEHDWVGHGKHLYEDNLRIPLLMRWPRRIAPATRFAHAVTNADIGATILDAAGIGSIILSNLDGRSLLRALEMDEAPHEALFIETDMSRYWVYADWDPHYKRKVGARRRGVLRGDWKYIETEPAPIINPKGPHVRPTDARGNARVELYHLRRDPDELQPLKQSRRASLLSKEFKLLLDQHRRAHPAEGRASSAKLPDDHLERLRILGYAE